MWLGWIGCQLSALKLLCRCCCCDFAIGGSCAWPFRTHSACHPAPRPCPPHCTLQASKLLLAARNLTRPPASVNTGIGSWTPGLREMVAELGTFMPGAGCWGRWARSCMAVAGRGGVMQVAGLWRRSLAASCKVCMNPKGDLPGEVIALGCVPASPATLQLATHPLLPAGETTAIGCVPGRSVLGDGGGSAALRDELFSQIFVPPQVGGVV